MEGLERIRERLSKGWTGTLFSVLLAAVLAFAFYKLLGLALGTTMPLVAVYSHSMTHANAEKNHYQWLEKNFNYSREFVCSWPFPNGIEVGDMPVVAKSDEYKIGDVVVYLIPQSRYPIIHRIVAKNEDGTFLTKGDNNPSLDVDCNALGCKPRRVSVEQIEGRVIFIIPKLGYFKVLLTKVLEFFGG